MEAQLKKLSSFLQVLVQLGQVHMVEVITTLVTKINVLAIEVSHYMVLFAGSGTLVPAHLETTASVGTVARHVLKQVD